MTTAAPIFVNKLARFMVCGVGALGREALEIIIPSLKDKITTLCIEAGDAAGPLPSPLTVQVRLSVAAADDQARSLAETCAQRDRIADALCQADLVIVLADLGSAMGRGAAKALLAMAREYDFATVACVVLPEADNRALCIAPALAVLDDLAHDADAYLPVREGQVRDLSEETPAHTPGAVFAEAVRALVRPVLFPAAVRLDFADILLLLKGGGPIAVGLGRASGPNRGVEAAECAVAFPSLGRTALARAERMLLVVHGGSDLRMNEAVLLCSYIKALIGKDCRILIGVHLDDEPRPTVEINILCVTGER